MIIVIFDHGHQKQQQHNWIALSWLNLESLGRFLFIFLEGFAYH